MKYEVLDQKGKKVGEESLPKEIFNKKLNTDLIYQVITSQTANKRRSIAHTKDRGDVRGGGRKPWRQKGLGRARHGSIRSPIWIGGGVTFGPRKERIFKKKIPKKMKRLALFMLLSDKAKRKFLIILDQLKLETAKTKKIVEIFDKLPSKKKKALLALPEIDKKIILAARNIPYIEIIQARDLNCLKLASFKYLIMLKESIEVIKKTFLKK